jgi:hypothetical protein
VEIGSIFVLPNSKEMTNELQQAETIGANARVNNIKCAAQSTEFIKWATELFDSRTNLTTNELIYAFNRGWHAKHKELTDLELQSI